MVFQKAPSENQKLLCEAMLRLPKLLDLQERGAGLRSVSYGTQFRYVRLQTACYSVRIQFSEDATPLRHGSLCLLLEHAALFFILMRASFLASLAKAFELLLASYPDIFKNCIAL